MNTCRCLKTIKYHAWHIKVISELIPIGSFYNQIKIWNIDSGTCLQTYSVECKRIDYYVNCIIKLSDEKIASCSVDATIKIWNINSGHWPMFKNN
jgi:WD40 repeat protein